MFEHKKKLSLENESLIADYVEYLRKVVGAAKGTIYNRTYCARTFLAIQEKRKRGEIMKLTPKDIQKYVMKIADRYERSTLSNVRVTLRSFFKYLHMIGKAEEVLWKSIPEMPK